MAANTAPGIPVIIIDKKAYSPNEFKNWLSDAPKAPAKIRASTDTKIVSPASVCHAASMQPRGLAF